MTPLRESSPVLSGQRAVTSAHNCTSCNLLRLVWVDTDPRAPGGNQLRMSCTVEKGSRILNWRACISSAPTARNELKSALLLCAVINPVHGVQYYGHVPRLLTDDIELADVSEAFSTLL
ncbi:hypothetical protein TNCV_3786621 [Trichonephila clavipes]|nr:hypothetical protein TNCV_3786621 [Trichonephila clavipes]